MISIIYSTHKNDEYNVLFKTHLQKSIGIKNFEILEYQNNNEFSLAEIYNKGISESKYDIIVCCHNDIKLENNWGKKLLNDFENNPEYGIIGKAGSTYFPESGIYWEKMNHTMVGHVYHHPVGKDKFLSKYSAKLPIIVPVVTIDGLFISFNKNKIKKNFDETIGKFHFYDHSFCLSNYISGVKIGVTFSFDITHQSVGVPNSEFFSTKDDFIKKYGSHLPIDLKPEKIYIGNKNTKQNKNIGNVAVIIPTKGKINLIKDCVNSFVEHCNSDIFEIFIADTGSSNDEKVELKKYILENQSKIIIHLIEYDYYNFSKINNDVVKNHIGDNFKFLLFCNNDIILLNDVITNMLDVFKNYPKAGTVGGRLHFEDNTVQHDGIITIVDRKNMKYDVSHHGLKSYYGYNPTVKKVSGNTGALLMIRKNVFEKCGYFNENYISCFEDVELNYKCVLLGYENYNDGQSVAYHLESQSRNDDPEKVQKLNLDYKNNLLPFFNENFQKLTPIINFI